MSRQDIADYLIHFTKGINTEDAFFRLQKIISEQTLIGGDGFIKGGYRCVCFSEAPLSCLSDGLINYSDFSRYSPFGIMVHKAWLYERGGRPVIYQSEDEFYLLPDELQWKHVLYEPPKVDFSWEREWRIRTDILNFDAQVATIVVLNEFWMKRLIIEHEFEQSYRILQYEQIFDSEIAQMYYEPFEWKIVPLT